MSKDRLLAYVKEMSQAERRYFKQTLRQYSNNSQFTIYARLFDYLAKTNVFDQKDLLKKCPFISASQLQNIKARLYKRLLQSNRSYYSGRNENIEIYQYLIDYEILKKKRLYEQCLSVLTKAETKANQTGTYSLLRQIFEHQKYLLEIRLKGKKNKHLLAEVYKKADSIAEISQNLILLGKLEAEIYNVFKSEGRILRNKELLDEIIEKLDEIQLNTKGLIQNAHWRILFNYQSSLAYRLIGDMEKSEKYLMNIFKVFDEDKILIKTFSAYYFRSLNLSATFYNSVKDFEKALDAIHLMRTYSLNIDNDKDLTLMVFENANFQEIEVYLQARKFDKAVVLCEQIIGQLNLYESDIHNVNGDAGDVDHGKPV
jgi:hypothetical protein